MQPIHGRKFPSVFSADVSRLLLLLRQLKDVALPIRQMERKFAGKYEVKSTMDKVQNSARSARMMNDEGRLALVETICAQRSELFIRKSPATAKPSAETGHSSIVLPIYRPINLSLPEQ